MNESQIRRKYAIPDEIPIHTPWGTADSGAIVAPGVYFVGTPSHGGYKVRLDRAAEIPALFRKPGDWYEEDCDYAIVHAFVAGVCDREALAQALETLRHWHWREFEAHFGVEIQPGHSHQKDKHLFEEANRERWVVICAWGHPWQNVPAGMVGVIATQGGRRGGGVKERRFLVPAAEYKARGDHGFVIDESTHRPWETA